MNGFVLINKPVGMTSFQVTGAVKRKTGEKHCGHAGTLDPLASGVLPVMIGRATKFIDLLPDNTKVYEAGIVFGMTTTTLDCEGEVLSEQPVKVTREELDSVVSEFIGEIEQIPPMYSAVSKGGVKLYKLARQGIEVERLPRKITIHSIEVTDFCDDTAKILVSCSKGTYIRTLIDDIGIRLRCGAFMNSLERKVGNGFRIEECISLDDFERSELSDTVKKSDEAILEYPPIYVSPNQAKRFLNGGELSLERIKSKNDELSSLYYRVYGNNEFLGLGEKTDEFIKPKCVFN